MEKISGQVKLPDRCKVSEFTFPPNKAVYVTLDESVVHVSRNIPVMPCNHEEAGTRLVICTHAACFRARIQENAGTHCRH